MGIMYIALYLSLRLYHSGSVYSLKADPNFVNIVRFLSFPCGLASFAPSKWLLERKFGPSIYIRPFICAFLSRLSSGPLSHRVSVNACQDQLGRQSLPDSARPAFSPTLVICTKKRFYFQSFIPTEIPHSRNK